MNDKLKKWLIGLGVTTVLLLPIFLNPPKKDAYKTVSTYEEYKQIVDSDKIVMAVFGRNSCSWCNKFKPIYNEVAEEENVDIYYFDSDSFDEDEYQKIRNMGLKIPAECTSDQTEKDLSDNFGTPLSLFTQNGETIGCIGGYVDKTELLAKLKEIGMIK